MIIDSESGESTNYYAHNYQSGGVSSCSVSSYYPVVYSGGFDGSVFVYQSDSFSAEKVKSDQNGEISLDDYSPVEYYSDDMIKHYEVILTEIREHE